MSNQVTGRIISIEPTVQIPSKRGGEPFEKRAFLLDATMHDPYTGERSEFENIMPLEMSGEKCKELDQFKVGDVATVTFALQGRQWTNQAGEEKRILSVWCYKIELKKRAVEQAPVQQQPPVQQTQNQQYDDGLPF